MRPAAAAVAATAAVALGVALAGCGNTDDPARPATTPAPSAAQIERAESASRRLHIDEVISEYLSELRSSPAAADNPRNQALTGNQLSTEIATAPAPCGEAVIKVIGFIADKKLSGPSKEKRITTAMDAVHERC
jgi:hypothetical protein